MGALPSSEQAPKVLPSLSRWNWSKVCSELQSKVTFSPDLTMTPPPPGLRERVSWTDLEGGDLDLGASSNSSPKYRPKAQSVQQEKHCNEKAAHHQDEIPTTTNIKQREKFKYNFKYGVSLNILF